MLLILLNWLFVLITVTGIGWMLLRLMMKLPSVIRSEIPFELNFAAGLFGITFCGLIWNFYLPIDGWFRYGFFILSLIILLANRSEITGMWMSFLKKIVSLHLLSLILFSIVFLIALIKSAGPSELADEGGYFLPYIRWIESFCLTPGIANIEDRMGFNSAFHTACAIFSMREWFEQGLYDLNGLILIICSSYFITGPDRLIRNFRSARISDYLKAFFLLFLLRNMLTGSSADLSNVFLAELMIVLFIEKTEDKSLGETDVRTILIFILGLFLATIKFSSASLFLLVIFLLATSKQLFRTQGVVLTFFGVLFIGTWLHRGYILTGYFLFPLYQIDLFDPLWKVPGDVVKMQYYFVQQFARLNVSNLESEATALLYPGFSWVPKWFALHNTFNKITTLILLLSLLLSLFFLIPKGKIKGGLLALFFILLLNLTMWFISFPAYRFGWAIVIGFSGMVFTLLFFRTRFEYLFRTGLLILVTLLTLQSFWKTIAENKATLASNLLFPHPLEVPRFVPYQLKSGIKASVSESQKCWGINPPCFPFDHQPGLQMIGHDITDGFYVEATQ